MLTCRAKPFKVWSADRQRKKLVPASASTVQEVIQQGKSKRNIGLHCIKVVSSYY